MPHYNSKNIIVSTNDKAKSAAGIKMTSNNTLEAFVEKISDFDGLRASLKIDYFVYFLTVVKKEEGVNGATIRN